MEIEGVITNEKAGKSHECILNDEHPYKNPDCKNGVLWGICECCGQYFCHVPDGQFHDEACDSIYSQEEITEMGLVRWKP